MGALAIGRVATGEFMRRRGRVRRAEVRLLVVEEVTVGRFRLGQIDRERGANTKRKEI
jgi:hypothetical protein